MYIYYYDGDDIMRVHNIITVEHNIIHVCIVFSPIINHNYLKRDDIIYVQYIILYTCYINKPITLFANDRVRELHLRVALP